MLTALDSFTLGSLPTLTGGGADATKVPPTPANIAVLAAAVAAVIAKVNEIAAGTLPSVPTATVAATGTVQGDAAALSEGFNYVTGADDAKGVLLPAAAAGKHVIIKVGPGADLKVWPSTGDVINGLSANAAMTVVDDVCFDLYALDATTWYTLPLLPS